MIHVALAAAALLTAVALPCAAVGAFVGLLARLVLPKRRHWRDGH